MKKKLIGLMIAVMLIGGIISSGSAEATTIATLEREGITFTGSNVYVGYSGPAGYYKMTLSSGGISASYLSEDVFLKSSGGVTRPGISALGSNTNSITATTTVFSNGYYTMHGSYYYSVQPNSTIYSFSATY